MTDIYVCENCNWKGKFSETVDNGINIPLCPKCECEVWEESDLDLEEKVQDE